MSSQEHIDVVKEIYCEKLEMSSDARESGDAETADYYLQITFWLDEVITILQHCKDNKIMPGDLK
jgi:hypothetical protein